MKKKILSIILATIYQGQELGMENYPFEKIEQIRDPFAIDRYEQTKKRGDDTNEVIRYFEQRGRFLLQTF